MFISLNHHSGDRVDALRKSPLKFDLMKPSMCCSFLTSLSLFVFLMAPDGPQAEAPRPEEDLKCIVNRGPGLSVPGPKCRAFLWGIRPGVCGTPPPPPLSLALSIKFICFEPWCLCESAGIQDTSQSPRGIKAPILCSFTSSVVYFWILLEYFFTI